MSKTTLMVQIFSLTTALHSVYYPSLHLYCHLDLFLSQQEARGFHAGDAAKEEFHHLEQKGIAHRSNRDWASPLHIVQKSDGSWMPCRDFRRLNIISEADCYLLPNIADNTGSLAGTRVFSKLDLKKGYHQIPVHPPDVKKTAIIMPFGLFKFLRMPFGLKNAGMMFQQFIDRVLAGLPFVLVYLDDILVASPNRQSHVKHRQLVLECLRDTRLVLNRWKCQFFHSEVEFLGLCITGGSMTPTRTRLLQCRTSLSLTQ